MPRAHLKRAAAADLHNARTPHYCATCDRGFPTQHGLLIHQSKEPHQSNQRRLDLGLRRLGNTICLTCSAKERQHQQEFSKAGASKKLCARGIGGGTSGQTLDAHRLYGATKWLWNQVLTLVGSGCSSTGHSTLPSSTTS
jgi:hypothetical protein